MATGILCKLIRIANILCPLKSIKNQQIRRTLQFSYHRRLSTNTRTSAKKLASAVSSKSKFKRTAPFHPDGHIARAVPELCPSQYLHWFSVWRFVWCFYDCHHRNFHFRNGVKLKLLINGKISITDWVTQLWVVLWRERERKKRIRSHMDGSKLITSLATCPVLPGRMTATSDAKWRRRRFLSIPIIQRCAPGAGAGVRWNSNSKVNIETYIDKQAKWSMRKCYEQAFEHSPG